MGLSNVPTSALRHFAKVRAGLFIVRVDALFFEEVCLVPPVLSHDDDIRLQIALPP
jgi:hypothetical protein